MVKRRRGLMPRHIPLRRDRASGARQFGPGSNGRQACSAEPFPDDFNDTALGRELTARWGDINQAARARHHAVVTTMSMQDALIDVRWRAHVLEWVRGVAMWVKGLGSGLECLGCRRRWTMTRAPVAVAVAVAITELVPLDRAMVSGLCQCCVERSDLRARIFAGLERGIGLNTATARPVHEGTRA